ncbi:XdhC family protein [Candidatus Poribacteria bacterium]|nr:XdhC family protein [Candidatus Poribacteria bacterium]MYB65706.1 XdhC family protein [Candidatus Poribacteria bacterium]MYF54839.1 XdhC family protein [Candidatus Poribacteria bacterium]MYI94133.1 XdhC family protein [Candidatus Poribacteria bacterium]
MREIYQQIPELIKSDQVGAYCTVVETKGSTPQKPGSKLLILPDLRNIGTLGGGCVEAEARRQAIGLMQGGIPRLLDFQLDSDYGWDDGLICGGNMKIFIDLPKTQAEAEMFTRIQELNREKVPLMSATVVESKQPHIRVGMKMVFAKNGQRIGTLGDPKLETEIETEISDILERNRPGLYKKDKTVSIFLEPIQPRPTLLIAGAGHVGQALCHIGSWLDFDIAIIDDRADFASKSRLPEADEIIIGDIAEELRHYPINHLTYVVIVTRGHQHDESALHSVVESDARYIGLIGSRRKIKLIFDDLLDVGIPIEKLQRVYAPIGLDINSKTVPEIAVSIASQLIQVRNGAKVHIDGPKPYAAQPARMPSIKLTGDENGQD